MDSHSPQLFRLSPRGDPQNDDVVSLLESFKAMSTAHGIHHITHASGKRWTLFTATFEIVYIHFNNANTPNLVPCPPAKRRRRILCSVLSACPRN